MFPDEGGPAILEFDVPDDLIGESANDTSGKACNWGSDIWFEAGFGQEELLEIWDEIPKTLELL